jgi:hypothetical protein
MVLIGPSYNLQARLSSQLVLLPALCNNCNICRSCGNAHYFLHHILSTLFALSPRERPVMPAPSSDTQVGGKLWLQ